MKDGLDAFVSSIRGEFEEKLREWVEIPTVSALPEHRNDIRRGAEAATEYLNSLGARARIVETPGGAPHRVGVIEAGRPGAAIAPEHPRPAPVRCIRLHVNRIT